MDQAAVEKRDQAAVEKRQQKVQQWKIKRMKQKGMNVPPVPYVSPTAVSITPTKTDGLINNDTQPPVSPNVAATEPATNMPMPIAPRPTAVATGTGTTASATATTATTTATTAPSAVQTAHKIAATAQTIAATAHPPPPAYPSYPAYPPHPAYHPNSPYPPHPAYPPHPSYPPHASYPPYPGYPPHPAYPPHATYPPHPTYPPKAEPKPAPPEEVLILPNGPIPKGSSIYYAVRRGRNGLSGCIFVSWQHAEPHVHKYKLAEYAPFPDLVAAENWLFFGELDGTEDKKRDLDDPEEQVPKRAKHAVSGQNLIFLDLTGEYAANSTENRQGINNTLYEEGQMLDNNFEYSKSGNKKGDIKSPLKKQWLEMYEQLVMYRKQHGTCNIPKDEDNEVADQKLINFIKKQRKEYRRYKEEKPSQIIPEKIELLKKIDFDFGYDENPLKKQWLELYERLVKYREKHGTCYIPKGTDNEEADQSLFNFVNRQQSEYKKYLEGKPSQIIPKKVELLKKINFDFGYYTFEERLEQLRQYRDVCGDSTVVPSIMHQKLGKFTKQAFSDIEKFKEGKELAYFKTSEIEKLLEIGFEEKNAPQHIIPSTEDEDQEWLTMFEELKEYKQSTGSMVPPQQSALSKWIKKQRLEHAKFSKGKPSRLKPQQMKQLMEAGLDFAPHMKHMRFEDRVEQLREYKRIHGHINIPSKHPKYGRWIQHQRTQHRMYEMGDKNSTMTEERIRILSDLGFVFQAGKRHDSDTVILTWEERFEQLMEYKEIHGDVLVPQLYDVIPGLGKWVKDQRKQYKYMLDGKQTSLNSVRIHRLAEVGFVWNTFKHRRKERMKQEQQQLQQQQRQQQEEEEQNNREVQEQQQRQRMHRRQQQQVYAANIDQNSLNVNVPAQHQRPHQHTHTHPLSTHANGLDEEDLIWMRTGTV